MSNLNDKTSNHILKSNKRNIDSQNNFSDEDISIKISNKLIKSEEINSNSEDTKYKVSKNKLLTKSKCKEDYNTNIIDH